MLDNLSYATNLEELRATYDWTNTYFWFLFCAFESEMNKVQRNSQPKKNLRKCDKPIIFLKKTVDKVTKPEKQQRIQVWIAPYFILLTIYLFLFTIVVRSVFSFSLDVLRFLWVNGRAMHCSQIWCSSISLIYLQI